MRTLNMRSRLLGTTIAVATLALSGCSGGGEVSPAPAFDPADYVELQGTAPIVEEIDKFNLPQIDLSNAASLGSELAQAIENSQYVSENAGSIQRTDFKDGEFMTYVYDPSNEELTAGFWYLRSDETSGYGQIPTPLVSSDADFELPLTALDKIEEFIEKEYSVEGDSTIVAVLAGTFEFHYLIEDNLITEIKRVDGIDDEELHPTTSIEYGQVDRISMLSQHIQTTIENASTE